MNQFLKQQTSPANFISKSNPCLTTPKTFIRDFALVKAMDVNVLPQTDESSMDTNPTIQTRTVYIVDNFEDSHGKIVERAFNEVACSNNLQVERKQTNFSPEQNNQALREILTYAKPGDGVNLSAESSLHKSQIEKLLGINEGALDFTFGLSPNKEKLMTALMNDRNYAKVVKTIELLEQLTKKGVTVTVPAGNYAVGSATQFVNLLSFAEGVKTVSATAARYSAVNEFTIRSQIYESGKVGDDDGTSFAAPRYLAKQMCKSIK